MIAWKTPISEFFTKVWHKIHTTEGMEDPWETEIELTEETVLAHSTTCERLVQMLRDAAHNYDDGSSMITIKGRESPVHYTGANLVWTAVQLTEQEKSAIPDSCGGMGELITSPKGYGSVCLQFPLGSVIGSDRKHAHAHILSTRQYTYEYSQAILVTPFESVSLRRDEEPSVTLETMDSPISLLGHKWKLGFSKQYGNKSWTHPELVFHGDLTIPLGTLKVSFMDHKCGAPGKSCDDCGFYAEESREKFNELMHTCCTTDLQDKYEIQEVNDELNIKITPSKSGV